VGIYARPESVRHLERDVASFTCRCYVDPFGNSVEDVVILPEQGLFLEGIVEPVEAEVIVAALRQGKLDVGAQERKYLRYVLFHELVLQVDCCRRNNYPFAIQLGPPDCRNEVGEGLANSGASLTQYNSFLVEAPCYQAQHIDLGLPGFVAGSRARQSAAG